MQAEVVRAVMLEHRQEVLAAVEVDVLKWLRAKDEEIERIMKMNWELREQMRGLCMECQVWRDLA